MVTIQISKGALVASLLAVSISVYTISFSQGKVVIQRSQQVVAAKNTNVADTIKQLNDPMFIMKGRIDALESNVMTLTRNLKKTQDDLRASQGLITELQLVNRPPKGYTTMFITKANFGNVDNNSLMKFFVRY